MYQATYRVLAEQVDPNTGKTTSTRRVEADSVQSFVGQVQGHGSVTCSTPQRTRGTGRGWR
jgi:hypothetical protein